MFYPSTTTHKGRDLLMKKHWIKLLALAFIFCLGMPMVACDHDAGDAVEDDMEAQGEAIEDATDDVGGEMEDMGDEAEDAYEEAGDEMDDAMDEAEDDMNDMDEEPPAE
jgi:hypothetical protein